MHSSKFIFTYLVLRTIVWTLVIYWTQPTLTLDVLEHLAWGKEWEWTYYNHPGLPAWINEFTNTIFFNHSVFLSALSPVFTALAIYAVWLLSFEILKSRTKAYIAGLSLEGILYFHVSAVEFNHNVALLTCSAFLCLTAYWAFVQNRRWLWLGIVAGLSLHAKYSAVLLILALFFWSIWDESARKKYKHAGPYIAMTTMAIIILPSIPDLIQSQFSPIQFAISRAKPAVNWWQHITYPLNFLLSQLLNLLLASILLFTIYKTNKEADSKLSKSEYGFLFTIAFIPLLEALVISLLGGIRLRSMWGSAMLSFIPLWYLAVLNIKIDNITAWRRGLLSIIALSIFAVVATFSISPYITSKGKRVHYPGNEIAAEIDKQWAQQYPDIELSFVIGSKHLSSLLSYYSQYRPSVVVDNNLNATAWASEHDITLKGAVIVWISSPPAYIAQYNSVEYKPAFAVNWLTGAKIPPLTVQWAIIPPADSEK